MGSYAYFQKQIVPLEDAKIGVMTHAFNYGTGVFEGIRGNWNADRKQIFLFKVREHYERLFRTEDLAPGEVIVAATGVSNGDLLRGVRFLADSARTHSLLMCTRCNWVRFVDGIHFFARERREEVRLLGQ